MKYVVTTGKTVEEATQAVQVAAGNHQFGVLHIHDLQATMQSKGVGFPHACKILEICNPQKAQEVLTEDMDLNMVLPCRISVYESRGETCIGMIRPTALLGSLSDSPVLLATAEEVERTSIRIIEEAK
jgi:uncharacterized protein (DUF302 family)